MTQRRHHYEVAFEDYLRQRRIPYVAVDEAKKSLLPGRDPLRFTGPEASTPSVKSFDFVIYGQGLNLLVEVKGRRIPRRASRSTQRRPISSQLVFCRPPPRSSLQNWVTTDDVEGLRTWAGLFGEGFEAAFVFVYWCDDQPPDALFQEVFENRGRWYALRTVPVNDYARAMKPRSIRWRTVHVPAGHFERISRPFAPPDAGPLDPQASALDPHAASYSGPSLALRR